MKMLIAAMLALSLTAAAPPPDLTRRIAAIQRFSAAQGGRLWRGYDKAPFGFLLIEGDRETIFCRDPLPDGFASTSRDPALTCTAGTRARSQFPATLLAAMPLFGPPSTIVMGTPESTGRAPADWTRTILHEHFHQWQDSLLDVFARMAALDLAGDDKSGMWMLNFAFPYSNPTVGSAQAMASHALAAAVRARGTTAFGPRLKDYLGARRAFASAAGARNWRYAELQLWKEGVARWTEIQLGRRYPDAAVRASAVALQAKTLAALDKPDLASAGREFVYPYGAGEAMILEACDPGWRARYPSLLSIGPLLERAGKRCGR